jgi:pantoate kinase
MDHAAVAFCPGHISGYFKRVQGVSRWTTGSIGAGVVISEGVRAEVRKTERPHPLVTIESVNPEGRIVESDKGSAPIEYILERLHLNAEVRTFCRVPIGSGFGMSAAALLSSISALNTLFHLGLEPVEVAALAHEAEIVHRSGLGDVAACQEGDGGIVCRKGPGIDAPMVRLPDSSGPIAAVNFGPLDTACVLDSDAVMQRVEASYPDKCPQNVEDFFALSLHFAQNSGLITPEVEEVLEACERSHVPASMTMLGNGVFAYGNDARECLAPFGHVFECSIHGHGVTRGVMIR